MVRDHSPGGGSGEPTVLAPDERSRVAERAVSQKLFLCNCEYLVVLHPVMVPGQGNKTISLGSEQNLLT